jgi:2-haloacid dehalogenase
MALDTGRVETVTFDSFSTLVDVDSTARAVPDRVDDPVAFAREWHARAADYGAVANQIDAYETYLELHRHALAYLLAERGIEATADEIAERTAVYHEMAPFDDVADGLARLADAGYRLGVVSNGDPAMLESLVAVTGVGDLLAATVSAHEIRRHKPAAELYEHAADRLGTPPARIAHVSNGQTDVMGAVDAGLQGIWLDRQDAPHDPFGPSPDATVDSIHELADRLGA